MIRLNGRVNKTTWGGRLADVNELLESYLNETGLLPRHYLDVGVSSGIISWDWCRRLKQSGRPFKMVATDIVFSAFLIPIGPGLRVLSDCHGEALQYDFFGYGIRPGRPRPRDWLTGAVIISAFMRLVYRWRLRGIVNNKANSCNFSTAIKLHYDVRVLQLVSPRVLGNEEITFVEDDVLTPAPINMRDCFDVIRIANLLNHDYFSVESMLTICQRLKQCMAKANSLLIVCRTSEDGANHGTIFRLSQENVLIPVMRVGGGSEIETIVSQS